MDPFLRPDSPDEVDMLTDAALAALAAHGLAGLSVSALARWIGVTPPALTIRWRTADEGARARILRLVVARFGYRWHLWSRGPLIGPEPCLSLPITHEEAAGVRAWLSLRDLARSELAAGHPGADAAVAAALALERDDVRQMVRTTGGQPMEAAPAAAVCALADGLRSELVATEPAVDIATAERLLRSYVALQSSPFPTNRSVAARWSRSLGNGAGPGRTEPPIG